MLWEAHFPEGMVKEICEDWFVESSICGGDFWWNDVIAAG